MVIWYHWLNGHEFEQTLGDTEGQESLACCSPWGHKESGTTYRLNTTTTTWEAQNFRDQFLNESIFITKELHIVKFPTGIYVSLRHSEAGERVGEERPADGHTGFGRDPLVQTRELASYHLTGWHSSAPRWRRSAKNNHLPPSTCNLGNCFWHLSSLALYKYCLLQMLEEVMEREKEEN